VLAEPSFVLNDPVPGLKLVARGDLILNFDLAADFGSVLEWLKKYRDRRMELADACLVCLGDPSMRAEFGVWTNRIFACTGGMGEP
jgi:hypothetical protein